MFRMMMLLVVAGGLSGLALFGVAQPPGDGGPGEGPPDGPPKGAKGGKGEKGPKGEGKFGSAKGKGKFQPGMVIPPHVVADLELSSEQNKSIKDLEKEVLGRLEKILKPEQMEKMRNARPPMGGPGGSDGPPGFGPNGPGQQKGPGGPGGGNRPARPGADDEVKEGRMGGIQWFSTWESAKVEAARTGKPILLVSAAPHCAGIPGIW